MSGEIPAELGSLSNLERLVLENNKLSGEIPAELGSLSNLEWFHLRNNDLSGEIPPELGSLSNLESLSLSGNFELSGEIPAELGSLSYLTYLSLSLNELSGEIPAELGSLSNLTELHLGGNELSGEIPPELGSLSNLRRLLLDDNKLSGEIPLELGSLSNLEWLRPLRQRPERGDTGGVGQPLQPDRAAPLRQRVEWVRAKQPGRPVSQNYRRALLLKPRALSRGRTAYRPYRPGGAPSACWLWRMALPSNGVSAFPFVGLPVDGGLTALAHAGALDRQTFSQR